MRVAALYLLAKSSPYYAIEGVDCWNERRDARLYDGPLPVVAHPPCGPWSRFWRHASKRYPKELAIRAVEQVRKWGGLLEHPAHSLLWEEMGLPSPEPAGQLALDGAREFSIEVEQCWWGHKSRKRTWLYLVGISREAVVLPPACNPPPAPESMRFDKRRGRWSRRAAIDLGSPESRKRTPPAFARWLVDLAAQSATSTLCQTCCASVIDAGMARPGQTCQACKFNALDSVREP